MGDVWPITSGTLPLQAGPETELAHLSKGLAGPAGLLGGPKSGFGTPNRPRLPLWSLTGSR